MWGAHVVVLLLKHCRKVATDLVLDCHGTRDRPQTQIPSGFAHARCQSLAVLPPTSCGPATRQDSDALRSSKRCPAEPPDCISSPARSKPVSKERYPLASYECRVCARRCRHGAALLGPLPPAVLPG